jgi:uncharacterized RDD family membrane protein YckC
MENEILDDLMDQAESTNDFTYASFWKRLVAALIDGIIVSIPMRMIMFFVGATNPESALQWSFVSAIVQFLYFTLMESSERQATIGKSMLHIYVIGTNGQRISFGQAAGRYFSKILSALILCIGYLMPLFTEKKQALHDMIASTYVVE